MIINDEEVKTGRRWMKANTIIKLARKHNGNTSIDDLAQFKVYGYSKYAGKIHINNKRTVCTSEFEKFEVVFK